ncbi:hypothetical protein EB796_014252 [Bugula neritina]|uniref:GB1/RHD3-type G domain-containing protein n=1 Tax=Bugula neritina TaxID=10212 RepID=A0A7J7JNJ3_BUGNE|nr:hypothetical protein EB796_014252 [Bugula neritina]
MSRDQRRQRLTITENRSLTITASSLSVGLSLRIKCLQNKSLTYKKNNYKPLYAASKDPELFSQLVEDEGRAVQIVEFKDDIGPVVNLRAFGQIVKSDIPTLVVSISGVARSGKSFLLNLWSTYLLIWKMYVSTFYN